MDKTTDGNDRLQLSRRDFLGVAGSSAAALLLRSALPAAAARPVSVRSAVAPAQAAAALSVMDPRFGARGDGISNDRAAFQAAIDAAILARVPLAIPRPPIHYLIELDPTNDRLEIGGDLIMQGAGRDACLLRFNISGAGSGKNYSGIVVRSGANVRISDLRLDEQLRPRGFEFQGIFFEAGSADAQVIVDNVTIDGFTNCLYSPASAVGDGQGELFLTLRNCDVTADYYHCLAFWAPPNARKRLHIYDSSFQGSERSHLIYCHPHITVLCDNCRFDNVAQGWAFHLQGSSVAGDPEYQRFVGCWFGPGCNRGLITQDRAETYTQVEVRNCVFECRPSIQIRSDIVISNCYFTTPPNPSMGSTFISAYSNAPWKAEIVSCVFAPQANSLPMIDLRLEQIEVAIRNCQFYNQGSATIIALGRDPANRYLIEDCLFHTRQTNGAQSIVFEISNGQTLVDRCRFVGRATGDRAIFTLLGTADAPAGDTRLQLDDCQIEDLSGGSLFFVEVGGPGSWSERVIGSNNHITNLLSAQPLLRTALSGQPQGTPTGFVGRLAPAPGTPESMLPAGPMLIISSNYDSYRISGLGEVNTIHWWSADGASNPLFSGDVSLTAVDGMALVSGGNINLNGAARRDVGAGQSVRLRYDPAQAVWVEAA